MRRPSEKKDVEDVPPGGRAFQRIQQERIARGLGRLPTPGTSTPASDKRAVKQDKDKTRKKK